LNGFVLSATVPTMKYQNVLTDAFVNIILIMAMFEMPKSS